MPRPDGEEGSEADGRRKLHFAARPSISSQGSQVTKESHENDGSPAPRRWSDDSGEAHLELEGEEEEEEEEEESLEEEDSESEDEDDDYFEEGESTTEDSRSKRSGEEQRAYDLMEVISNETDPSEEFGELPGAERQMAMVITDPPWSGKMRPLLKMAVACMLPILLALLLIYGFFKLWGYFFQCFFDVVHLLLRIVWLAVRIGLSPLYVLWRALVPSYIQRSASQAYEEYVGDKVSMVLQLANTAEGLVTDFPRYSAACYLAAMETFVEPARARCSECLYRLAGRRAEQWVFDPWYNREINRGSKQRRKRFDEVRRRDPAVREEMRKLGPKRARAKKRAARERAKHLKRRKQLEALEVNLMLPINDKSKHHPDGISRVQLPEQIKSVSRVMVVERRYAIAVGLIWIMIGAVILISTLDGSEGERCEVCSVRPDAGLRICRRYAIAVGLIWIMIGAVILISTLDGSEGERCEVCSVRPDVGLRICRHGQGSDCAFSLHMREIVVSIAIMAVGGLLTVYAVFLYKPRAKAPKVPSKDTEEERKRSDKQRSFSKDEDPELQAVQYLLDQLKQPTFARNLRGHYQRSSLASRTSCLLRCIERCLRRLLRFEEEHHLRERSIVLKDALYFMAIGWAAALVRLLTCQGRLDVSSPREIRSKTVNFSSTMTRTFSKKSLRQKIVAYLRRSRLGICILPCLSCLLGRSDAPQEAASASVGGIRTGARGPNILEDVLARFGLAPADGDDLEAGRHGRITFSAEEKDESQREFGLEDGENVVIEEEPPFQGDSDDEANDTETEEEGDAEGWTTEDERKWNRGADEEAVHGVSGLEEDASHGGGSNESEALEESESELGDREQSLSESAPATSQDVSGSPTTVSMS